VSYQPLAGVKLLDLGILIPAALTSGKLAALGVDVVKVEQPPHAEPLIAGQHRQTVNPVGIRPADHLVPGGAPQHRRPVPSSATQAPPRTATCRTTDPNRRPEPVMSRQ
jgi:hypothetical protein